MGFKDKLAGLVSSNPIDAIIKQNRQYPEAVASLIQASENGMNSLQEYIEGEAPDLADAMTLLAHMFEGIRNAKSEKITDLNDKFIGPLTSLSEEYKALQNKLKEAEKSKKAHDSAIRKLDKTERKNTAKLKPGELVAAQASVKSAEKLAELDEYEAKRASNNFGIIRNNLIKKMTKEVFALEVAHIESISVILNSIREKVEELEMDQEISHEEQQEPEETDDEDFGLVTVSLGSFKEEEDEADMQKSAISFTDGELVEKPAEEKESNKDDDDDDYQPISVASFTIDEKVIEKPKEISEEKPAEEKKEKKKKKSKDDDDGFQPISVASFTMDEKVIEKPKEISEEKPAEEKKEKKKKKSKDDDDDDGFQPISVAEWGD